jgi:DNA-directed RNA polymerase subunit RPC12/RpoP
MGECVNCQESLDGATLTLPWEDGDNPYAYVRCPHCGYENIMDGYGEDDD